MNFHDELSKTHSKELAMQIADICVKDKKKLGELMECFFSDDIRICQRASWSVCFVALKKSDLLTPYLDRMIENLEKPKHDAVVRNTVRAWEEMEIPEEYEGLIFEICFNYVVSTKHAVAIRAFAISVSSKIALKYPELREELISEFDNQLLYAERPAIKFRLKKYIKLLS